MKWVVLFLCLTPAGSLRADEWWAWSMLEFYRQPPWTAGLFMGNRADTGAGSLTQIISPRVKYELLPWLDLGIGLSTLRIENPDTHISDKQLRPEFEINPKFNLNPHLRLDWRNRMEWRLNEGESFTMHRTRHRLQIAWTFPKPLGRVTRIFANNECLNDLNLHKITENRLIPLGLTVNVNPQSEIDLFYMIVSKRPTAEWQHESILGTYLKLRF
jgi:hypothetical protein